MAADHVPEQVARMRAFYTLLKGRHARSLELYERGGAHLKDLELARAYSDLVVLFSGLFPEIGE